MTNERVKPTAVFDNLAFEKEADSSSYDLTKAGADNAAGEPKNTLKRKTNIIFIGSKTMAATKKCYDSMGYQADNNGGTVYKLDKGREYHRLIDEDSNGRGIFRGDPAKLLVTLCILLTEMCERLTYYSIAAGLVLFGTSNLEYSQVEATTINQVFGGFVYIIPIFGGFLSDSYFGRYKTILGSGCIYVIGLILVPASAIQYEDWGWEELSVTGRRAIFLLGLVFVALGTGGIKANVGPFGAEQVESLGKDAVQSFFNWFYWVINVGALIAYAGVSYIQQEISFAWGFFVPLASMVVALLIFIAASKKYVRTEPAGSALTVAGAIMRAGCCKPHPPPNPKHEEGHEKKLLAAAKESYGGEFQDHLVDGVVSVIKVSPFCLLVIMYWTIYAQMTNTFFAQGERMDVRLGDSNVPVAALNVFNTVSIILFIPIVDRLFYPCMERIGHPLTYLKRIGIGFVFAALSVVVAGVVEIYRKEELFEPGGMHEQTLADEKFNASSMSVFVQVPQFALVGMSEIFTSVTALEFAYNQAPVSMQGLVTGLFLAASGIGNWVSTAILLIVEKTTESDPWWGDEINDTKMENLMWLLAAMMGLNFLVFIIVSHFYTYQDPSTFEIVQTDKRPGTDNAPPPGQEETVLNEKQPLNGSYHDNGNHALLSSP